MDLESPSVEMKTHAVDQRVQNLIQQARQGDVEDIIELFEEGHPFRLLFEIMDSPYFNKKVEAKLELLRQLAPKVC